MKDMTYASFVEATHAGEVWIEQYVGGTPPYRYRRLPPVRGGQLDALVRPSYHFNELLADVMGKQVLVQVSDDPLEQLGLEQAAFLSNDDPNTILLLVDAKVGMVGMFLHVSEPLCKAMPPNVWVQMDGRNPTARVGFALTGIVADLLANPTIEYVMSGHSTGVQRLNAARERKGEELLPMTKVVHLTKRIYIGGTAIGGGQGSEKRGHVRDGHYRHSLKPHPGWEPIILNGVQHYRRRIKETAVKGGPVHSGILAAVQEHEHIVRP